MGSPYLHPVGHTLWALGRRRLEAERTESVRRVLRRRRTDSGMHMKPVARSEARRRESAQTVAHIRSETGSAAHTAIRLNRCSSVEKTRRPSWCCCLQSFETSRSCCCSRTTWEAVRVARSVDAAGCPAPRRLLSSLWEPLYGRRAVRNDRMVCLATLRSDSFGWEHDSEHIARRFRQICRNCSD